MRPLLPVRQPRTTMTMTTPFDELANEDGHTTQRGRRHT